MTEQARYEVRTPMWLWVSNGLLSAFCVVLTIGWISFGWDVPGFAALLGCIAFTTVLAFWASMSAYRIGGGRNLIRFYGDRVEVPGPSQRKPLVFRRDGLELAISDVLVKYRIGSVRRGTLIELRHAGLARKLSTLTLAAEADEPALVADFRRFVNGEDALGRAGHVAARKRTSYDDRLDRELSALD